MSTAMKRVHLWDRGNDLAVAQYLSELIDDLGLPLLQSDVTTMTMQVHAIGVAEPPAQFAARTIPVVMSFDAVAKAWRGMLPYEADMHAVAEVRIIVLVTIATRTQRLVDAVGRFTLPDGR